MVGASADGGGDFIAADWPLRRLRACATSFVGHIARGALAGQMQAVGALLYVSFVSRLGVGVCGCRGTRAVTLGVERRFCIVLSNASNEHTLRRGSVKPPKQCRVLAWSYTIGFSVLERS